MVRVVCANASKGIDLVKAPARLGVDDAVVIIEKNVDAFARGPKIGERDADLVHDVDVRLAYLKVKLHYGHALFRSQF